MRKFQKKVSEFLFCSRNQRFSIRSTAVTGRNNTQAYMITLAEAKGAGGSFVHKAPNQKTDMSQKRVDFLSTQMSVYLFSTRDTCYFKNSDSQLSYIYTARLPTPHSLVWPLPPSSTFKLLQRGRPPPGW